MTIQRILVSASFVLAALSFNAPNSLADHVGIPYGDGSAFDKAQADASAPLLLLDFHSDRCSSCVKQAKALSKLLHDKMFKGFSWYVVQYEGTTPLSTKYEVDHSSLVVFRGKEEIGRGIGHMDEKSLRKLLSDSLAAKKKS